MILSTLLLLSASTSASAALLSRQVELGGNEYFLPPTPAFSFGSWTRNASRFSDPIVPLTVVYSNGSAAADVLRSTFEAFNDTDDVWTPSFTEFIYLQYSTTRASNGSSDSVESQLAPDYNITAILPSTTYNISINIPNSADNTTIAMGPYFLDTYSGAVYQAYKLYVDTNQAFLQSSYQDPNGMHHTLRAAAAQSAAGLTVAVPSRLYFTPSKERPLDGFRIGVKDLYDLKGLKTSGGSKDYFDTSDVKNNTATAVQKLIDAGAVIVGKNKLSMFAFAGQYVTDHIDYLLPVNPRGDAYNTPGDSSGGSGAAVAAYDWLDASMGSDTGGSIRGPAIENGVLGNRPSQDAVSLDGALPLSTTLDTSGILARDPATWSSINKVLYAGFAKEYPTYPKNIYVFESDNSSITDNNDPDSYWTICDNFVTALLNVTSGSATSYSIDVTWNATNHSAAFDDRTLSTGVNDVYRNLTRYEQWNSFGKSYIQNYTSNHDGNFPYVTYNTLNGWLAANSSITPDDYNETLTQRQEIVSWARQSFLKADNQSCSDAIYVNFWAPAFEPKLDITGDDNPYLTQIKRARYQLQQQVNKLNITLACNATLNASNSSSSSSSSSSGTYSNTTLSSSSNSTTSNSTTSSQNSACAAALAAASTPFSADNVTDTRLASVAGFPQFAVTLGTTPVYSNITRQNMSVPVGVLLMAGYGCDFVLQNLVTELYQNGAIPKIRTGVLVD